MIKPWVNVRSTPIGDFRVFKLRSDLKRSPRTGKEHDFFVLESVDWVNVIATTTDNRLVMVEQYRHGSNSIELEVPGGMMDATDPSPLETALRELREETGYEGAGAQLIGKVYANPAIMSNTCHTALVQQCELKHPTAFDHGEDIMTRLVPIAEIPSLVATGKIAHSLVVVALYHFDLWRRVQQPSITK